MQRADGAQKTLGLADDQHRQRQEEEHVDRDENDEHPVPGDADPVELDGHRQIDEEENAAVGAPRRDQRQIFLEREEADEGEEDQRDRPAGHDGEAENERHQPPAAQAEPQLLARRGRAEVPRTAIAIDASASTAKMPASAARAWGIKAVGIRDALPGAPAACDWRS